MKTIYRFEHNGQSTDVEAMSASLAVLRFRQRISWETIIDCIYPVSDGS